MHENVVGLPLTDKKCIYPFYHSHAPAYIIRILSPLENASHFGNWNSRLGTIWLMPGAWQTVSPLPKLSRALFSTWPRPWALSSVALVWLQRESCDIGLENPPPWTEGHLVPGCSLHNLLPTDPHQGLPIPPPPSRLYSERSPSVPTSRILNIYRNSPA